MAQTKAKIGKGVVFGCNGTASGGTTTVVAEITDYKPGKRTTDTVVVERHDAPTTEEEKIVSWSKYSDAELELTCEKGQYGVLKSYNDTPLYWSATYPGVGTDVWFGFLTELGNVTPIKDKMVTQVKVCVSGPVTFTPAP